MTLTVLEPEGLYPDTSLEQRIMGPSVRILQGACKTSLAELPDAICQQVEGLMTASRYPLRAAIVSALKVLNSALHARRQQARPAQAALREGR